jgi:AbrB family looped-hinge helix DNA binding protein
MPQATLSSKNQIVIPKEAREALGVKAGDKLLAVDRPSKAQGPPYGNSWHW